MSRKEEYIKRYEKLHTGKEGFLGSDGKVKTPDVGELFSGIQFIRKFMGDLGHIIGREKSISLLDYGCGKGQHLWRPYESYKNGVLGVHGHGIREIRLYDPAVPQFSTPAASNTYQVITCADVMEHVPEEDVDDVLADIVDKFSVDDEGDRVYLLFSISGNLAYKSFLDGENLHCTIKPIDWWKERITLAAEELHKKCEVILYYSTDRVERIQWIVG